jgi:heat-inducible transcriptional repressor
MGQVQDLRGLLQRTSFILSTVTSMASVVMLPKIDRKSLRMVEFLPLSDNRVLVIMVINRQEVENRIIHTDRPYSASELEQAANFLNASFGGMELPAIRDALLEKLRSAREEMNRMMQAVVEVAEKAFAEQDQGADYVVAGQTHLMGFTELADMDKLRQLFEAFSYQRDMLRLLDQALTAPGVQIFIGEESGYQVLDECSVVTSRYESEGRILGVLGVIGPTRMAYERVIPIVDLTAKLLGSALNSNH